MRLGRLRSSHWTQAGLWAASIVIMALGAVALIVPDETFTARATIAMDQVEGIAAAEGPGVIDKLERLRFKYAGLATTRTAHTPVAEALGMSEEEVAERVFAHAPPDSLLLHVGARHEQPDEAHRLAQETASFLVEHADQEQRAAGVPAAQRYELAIVTPADQVVRDAPPQRRLGVAAMALGLLLALGALVLLLSRDPG